MDSQQPITNWPRLVRSAILSLRNDLSAAYGYSKLVERVGPATEQQAKCLKESRRHLRRIVDTTDRLNKLMRWSQEPVWRPKVDVVELGPLVGARMTPRGRCGSAGVFTWLLLVSPRRRSP